MQHNNIFIRFIRSLLNIASKIITFTIHHAFEALIGPLIVIGSILCIMFIEPWPVKFVSIGVWLVFLYFLSKVIDKITGRDKRDN
ncbi:hypothetical protein [Rahnella sp. NRRL B-41462]|uniref:hypothetical protein n=1 Tax=Rahnella sp. NRRL B-41462 TaxID=1610579 RepID=UPI000DD4092D|nr:hypothetical protein [Rahnella sp. NRRL B-41462]